MQNWDDLRFLLAVSKTGTMSAAARELGTNVATVSRRIERLAAELGGAPFVKAPGGWRPSPAVAGLLEAAAAFEGQLREAGADTRRRVSAPQLRLGAPPLITSAVLLPFLDASGSPVHGVDLEIVQRGAESGLGGHDIVVQAGVPEAGRLAARPLGNMGFGIYRWRDAAETDRWIGATGAYARLPVIERARRMFGRGAGLRFEEFDQVLQAARLLRLPAVLPELLAAGEPMLVRLDHGEAPVELSFWLAHPAARRDEPTVQAVSDWLAAAFAEATGRVPPQQASPAAR